MVLDFRALRPVFRRPLPGTGYIYLRVFTLHYIIFYAQFMSEISDTLNQIEHEQISTSLEVEQIEVNLFRSKSLWLPIYGRGAFGG